jgi:hypothetical protein
LKRMHKSRDPKWKTQLRRWKISNPFIKKKKKMENFEFLSTYVAAIDGGGGSVERVPRFSFVRTFYSDLQWRLGSWGSPLYR